MTTTTVTTRRRVGRPASTVYGTVNARRRDSKLAISWSDGQWGGHPNLVAAARALARDAETEGVEPLLLPWGGGYTTADDSTLLGALAVMVDHTVCGADAELAGDIPEEYLQSLVDLGLQDPDTDTDTFMAARGF